MAAHQVVVLAGYLHNLQGHSAVKHAEVQAGTPEEAGVQDEGLNCTGCTACWEMVTCGR